MKTFKSLVIVVLMVLSTAVVAADKNAKSSSELDVTIQAQADGKVIVGFEKLAEETVYVRIFASNGELMYADKAAKESTTYLKKFDLSEVPAGNYSYSVSNGVYKVEKVIEKK